MPGQIDHQHPVTDRARLAAVQLQPDQYLLDDREKNLQIKAMDAIGTDGYHACALHS